jgi:thioredoxin
VPARNIDSKTFKDTIFDYTESQQWDYKGDVPMIIDFYADWCGPCKAVAPIMDKLSEDYEGRVDIVKVDTEKEAELSQVFGIKSIPSVLFIPKDGEPKMAVGALDEKGYKNAIEDIMGVVA